ncbi:hypothetical protein E4U17_002849 [Claviceps sp. LM77 group G4]|nr:hypothetical protein E4U17_002849 [Claviceps sp. LM77 group G4]
MKIRRIFLLLLPPWAFAPNAIADKPGTQGNTSNFGVMKDPNQFCAKASASKLPSAFAWRRYWTWTMSMGMVPINHSPYTWRKAASVVDGNFIHALLKGRSELKQDLGLMVLEVSPCLSKWLSSRVAREGRIATPGSKRPSFSILKT